MQSFAAAWHFNEKSYQTTNSGIFAELHRNTIQRSLSNTPKIKFLHVQSFAARHFDEKSCQPTNSGIFAQLHRNVI